MMVEEQNGVRAPRMARVDVIVLLHPIDHTGPRSIIAISSTCIVSRQQRQEVQD